MTQALAEGGARPDADERVRPDRRRRPTPMISRYLFRGRRRAPRRTGERESYVDRPRWEIITGCALVVGLSIADAYVTIRILAEGGQEANPVMALALTLGNTPFVAVKTMVTFLGAAVLCLHQQWALGRVGLSVVLGAYAVLALYHVAVQATPHWGG